MSISSLPCDFLRVSFGDLANGWVSFPFLRYIQCIHQKLYHLTQGDYEEFASIVVAARAAFQITPEGSAQFKDWLQSIKR